MSYLSVPEIPESRNLSPHGGPECLFQLPEAVRSQDLRTFTALAQIRLSRVVRCSSGQLLLHSVHCCPGAGEPQQPFVTCCPMCILQWAQQATLQRGLGWPGLQAACCSRW